MCLDKKMFSDYFLIVYFIIQLSGCLCFQPHGYSDGTLPHMENLPVAVRLHLNYDHASCPAASGHPNVSIGIINLPEDALLLNALEFGSHQFGHLLYSFELVYLSQVGYFVLAFNDLSANPECRWTMVTDPPISVLPVNIGPTGKSINDVYVSNYGLEVYFTYGSTGNSDRYIPVYDLLSGHVPWNIVVNNEIPSAIDIIDNPMKTTYAVSFPLHPTTCPQPPGFEGITLPLNISSGQTALNVVEMGGNLNVNLTFTVVNQFGLFYHIRSINTATQAGSCIWCVKYSPKSDGSVPSYPLSVALNDFTIPVEDGRLTLEYTTDCNTAQESLSRGVITEEVWLGSRRARMSWRKAENSVFRICVGVVNGLIAIVIIIACAWYCCTTTGHSKQS